MLRHSWLRDRNSLLTVRRTASVIAEGSSLEYIEEGILKGQLGNPSSYGNHHHHNRFTAFFPDYRVSWCQKKYKLLDFYGAKEDNRGRHTNHPAGCHSIQTNQQPTSIIPPIFTLDAVPATTHCILAWHRHQIFWPAYSVAWSYPVVYGVHMESGC